MRAGRLAAAVAAVLVHVPAGAWAQAEPDTLRFRLDSLQIPVTRAAVDPERAPVALSLVRRAEIQDARAAIGLDEALGAVPGLFVSNRYNFSLGSRIVIRGLGARSSFGVRGVRVLADGIPLTMPDGQTNLNNVDLGSAGAIHVLRGPASALFGNAAGGVIAVETEPAPGPFSAEARVGMGDQGVGPLTRLVRAQVKAGQTIGRTEYVASASRLRADGFRDHSRARQNVFNGRVAVQADVRTRLSFVLNVADAPVAESPGSLPLDSARARPSMAWPRNVDTGSGEAVRQAQAGLRLLHTGERGRADVSIHGIHRTLENPLPFGFIDLERAAGGARALYERRFDGPLDPVVTAGLDLEVQRDDRLEFANEGGEPVGEPRRDQADRVAGIGPFVQAALGGGAFRATVGARYDAIRFATRDRRGDDGDDSGERTLHAPSLMVGAVYTGAVATLFGNVASAFQTPTLTELINAPPSGDEPCCPAGFNPDLGPERTLSRELGVRGSAGGWRFEVVGYWMTVNDALVPFQVPAVAGRDFFRNAGRTRHRGAEISAARALTRGFDVELAWSRTDVRFLDDGSGDGSHEGNRVPGIPSDQLYVAAGWSHAGHRVVAEVRHTGEQFTDDANRMRSPRHTVLDVRARTALDAGGMRIAPFLALNNVLDARYHGSVTVNAVADRFFEPAPGFNVHLGVTLRTGAWRAR